MYFKSNEHGTPRHETVGARAMRYELCSILPVASAAVNIKSTRRKVFRQRQSLAFLVAFLTSACIQSFAFTTEQTQASLWGPYRVRLTTTVRRARRSEGPFGSGFGKPNRDPNRGRKRRRGNSNSTMIVDDDDEGLREVEFQQRLAQLEQLVASQTVEIKRLKDEVKDLTAATEAFAKVIELLRQAGLQTPDEGATSGDSAAKPGERAESSSKEKTVVEAFDDTAIFGTAPSSVIEAADVAGASILTAILGGKKRLLVDVRDAELSTSADTLVQFIELAVLPVAAGLEGLKSKRNRLKIVFPTVSQLLQYRRTMALAAPEVVALSTLGFDPVEQMDNLVVIVAPAPDDAEGLAAMIELLVPTDPKRKPIDQPVVVLNHHMVPISGPVASFEVAYHLRLLSVQFATGDTTGSRPDDVQAMLEEALSRNSSALPPEENDNALEAAMKHAQEVGSQYGVTRAMVIRAYPKPWHVFVDTSPDTDADFVVAATFDDEPTQEDVNHAIVECLQGSEEEDEIVAQQMQQAFEKGQLDRVTEILGSMGIEVFDDEDDDDDEDEWDLFDEDSV